MKIARLRAAMVLVLALTAVPPAQAWNDTGHMMVACIAYRRLTPTVRDRVNRLLALNPLYQQWMMMLSPGAPERERQEHIFMLTATWPDIIKGDPSYRDDGTANGNRPSGAVSARNIGYTDTLRHKYWHFVDIPFSVDAVPLPVVPSPNAWERIHVFRGVIASATAPDALKSYDVTWLLHLVGDVHQPLHAVARVSAGQPEGDQGGNLVQVADGGWTGTLHAFWDGIFGPQTSLVTTAALARRLPPAAASQAAVLDEAKWVQDSFELARRKVYEAPIGAGAGPFKVTTAYRQAARKVAEKQVALAGARLANVLNAELK